MSIIIQPLEEEASDETSTRQEERTTSLARNGSVRRGGRRRGGSARRSGRGTRTGARRTTGRASGVGAGTIGGVGHSSGLEHGKGLLRRGVHGEDHALLTVVGLTAVEPEGAGDIRHGEAVLHERRRAGGDGLEARIQAVCAEVRARGSKCRLSDSVVLGQECEGNSIAVLGRHLRGSEGERAVFTDVDIDDLCAGDADGEGGSEDGGETHRDLSAWTGRDWAMQSERRFELQVLQ